MIIKVLKEMWKSLNFLKIIIILIYFLLVIKLEYQIKIMYRKRLYTQSTIKLN
jgi:hypothetical protein